MNTVTIAPHPLSAPCNSLLSPLRNLLWLLPRRAVLLTPPVSSSKLAYLFDKKGPLIIHRYLSLRPRPRRNLLWLFSLVKWSLSPSGIVSPQTSVMNTVTIAPHPISAPCHAHFSVTSPSAPAPAAICSGYFLSSNGLSPPPVSSLLKPVLWTRQPSPSTPLALPAMPTSQVPLITLPPPPQFTVAPLLPRQMVLLPPVSPLLKPAMVIWWVSLAYRYLSLRSRPRRNSLWLLSSLGKWSFSLRYLLSLNQQW